MWFDVNRISSSFRGQHQPPVAPTAGPCLRRKPAGRMLATTMFDAEDARQSFLSLPGAEETQPFGPDVLVYKVGGKMFGTLVIEDDVGRINLKCDPQRAADLRAEWPGSILPGYHMNKRHWNTLVLDGGIPSNLTRELVTHSHDLVVATLPSKLRREFTAS